MRVLVEHNTTWYILSIISPLHNILLPPYTTYYSHPIQTHLRKCFRGWIDINHIGDQGGGQVQQRHHQPHRKCNQPDLQCRAYKSALPYVWFSDVIALHYVGVLWLLLLVWGGTAGHCDGTCAGMPNHVKGVLLRGSSERRH